MPYFDDLKESLEETLAWADVRHEQGVKVTGRVSNLKRQIAGLSRELQRGGPSRQMARREPNTLKDILAGRPRGPRKIWTEFRPGEHARRVKGAWLARAAGCTLGAIVELWSVERMQRMARYCKMKFPPTDYWTQAATPPETRYGTSRCEEYTKGGMRHVPADDDLTYTILGLLILEDYGPHFTIADVGKAWVKYLPMACTAEKVALDNLKAGVSWRKAGERDNPWMEVIGADIRSDPWGYAAAGWPEKAAMMAYRDAYISHRYNGIYGSMFFAATIAAAFTVDDPLDAVRIGLTEIPRTSRLYRDVQWALRWAPRVKDYLHARKLVDKRFAGMSPVHTNNNAALVIFGLALGGRDVTKVIGNTVAMGLDNDCTGATAGSIVGAVVGADGIPEHWTKPFRNKVRTYIKKKEWFTNTDIARRFTCVARSVWES